MAVPRVQPPRAFSRRGRSGVHLPAAPMHHPPALPPLAKGGAALGTVAPRSRTSRLAPHALITHHIHPHRPYALSSPVVCPWEPPIVTAARFGPYYGRLTMAHLAPCHVHRQQQGYTLFFAAPALHTQPVHKVRRIGGDPPGWASGWVPVRRTDRCWRARSLTKCTQMGGVSATLAVARVMLRSPLQY